MFQLSKKQNCYLSCLAFLDTLFIPKGKERINIHLLGENYGLQFIILIYYKLNYCMKWTLFSKQFQMY